MASSRSDEIAFRGGTGLVASAVIVVVGAIGWVLYSDSVESIWKFGFQFWQTDIWDPVAGEFGARPFIWGTLYSSVLALLIAGPVALGIAIYISELAPARARRPLVFLTELLAAIPSIVYGLWGIFVLVPFVRSLEVGTPEWLKSVPLFSGPPLGLGMLSAALLLARCCARCRSRSAKAPMRSARPGGKRSAWRSSTRAPASSARSCSDSAARSARRWR